MFIVKFCKVVTNEACESTFQLYEILQYQYQSTRDYFRSRKIKKDLRKKMNHANSYAEWKIYAEEFDKLKGNKLFFS